MKKIITLTLIINSFFVFSQEVVKNEWSDSSKVEVLKEIKITKNKRKAGVYKLHLPKEILKNESMGKTLRRVENITLDNNKTVYFKGKRIKNYIYNDKVITQEEFFKLLSENIVSFQIVENYFNLSTGETELVIKVMDNNGNVDNIKGSVDGTLGFLQEFNFLGSSLFYKKNKFSTVLNISGLKNVSDNSSEETYNESTLNYANHRVLYQSNFSMLNIYEIDKSSSISLRNKYSVVDENRISFFSDLSEAAYFFLVRDYNTNVRYEKRTVNDLEYKLNLDYVNSNNKIENRFNKSNQKFTEWTLSSSVSKSINKLYVQSALVLTYRNYIFDNITDRSEVRQKIVTPFVSFSYDLNSNNSLAFGNRFQFSEDKVNNDVVFYHNFYLPNFTYFSKIGSILDVEFNYKRYVFRPSIRSISNFTYQDFNNNSIVNPSYIKPEIDNSFSLDLVKNIKKVDLTLNFGYLKSSNNISVVNLLDAYKMVSENVNLDSYNSRSVGTSVSFKFYKESRFNLNYSYTKLKMKKANETHKGVVNYLDLSVSGNIDKSTMYSINSYYIDRFYDFNLYRSVKPDLSLSVSRNLLKDRLNISLEYRNILNTDANRMLRFRDSGNEYVLNNTNTSNIILINASYNFGKTFKENRKYIRNISSDMKL
ncbi:outer membrane beta-barrel family protein [Flavobacterium collinsii]|uniref:OMP_b-brl_3 domain-containing protein n=1 Tax=Flavobacterium collinsii TaxID=1114861 RepID=A0A9W4X9P1_9FLAO|nr:outer membrane beta-barrel family protein [Flavobacterium collinsii]CAI2766876.1 OMP_b-brl_3 domain-containing protein [Flavobacterium collinsii]